MSSPASSSSHPSRKRRRRGSRRDKFVNDYTKLTRKGREKTRQFTVVDIDMDTGRPLCGYKMQKVDMRARPVVYSSDPVVQQEQETLQIECNIARNNFKWKMKQFDEATRHLLGRGPEIGVYFCCIVKRPPFMTLDTYHRFIHVKFVVPDMWRIFEHLDDDTIGSEMDIPFPPTEYDVSEMCVDSRTWRLDDGPHHTLLWRAGRKEPVIKCDCAGDLRYATAVDVYATGSVDARYFWCKHGADVNYMDYVQRDVKRLLGRFVAFVVANADDDQ
jgi:hypothetical protein